MGSNLELNKDDQFIFGIDVSGSMQERDAGGLTRIEACKEAAISLIREASKWDEDGVDVLTFGHQIKHLGAITADKAEELIKPLKATEASTDTAGLIRKAYELHVAKASSDQTVLFIVTDGEPNDEAAVITEIRRIAKEQEAEKEVFSIGFLTVGNIAPSLQAFLTKLDDTLDAKDKNGNPIDIVDVKELAGIDFVTAFAGAIGD